MSLPAPTSRRLAFLMATLGTGGIGKMRVHLTRELARRGEDVDLVLGKADGPYVGRIDPGVQVYPIDSTHWLYSLGRIARYLRRRRPAAVVAEKLRVNVALHRARRLSGTAPRVVASIHGVLSHKLDQEGLPARKRAAKYAAIRRWYPLNDAFVTVSQGIKDDLVANFGIPADKVHVVRNPVVTPELLQRAAEPAEHPWLTRKEHPVILGVGRLAPQKDFPTLLRAFARVRAGRPARLVILGEGSERPHLEALARELGIADNVSLPGYVDNPYAALAAADLFVLSSQWEGSPNVLTEALAVGVPAVSTDCPGRPRETLQDGRFGPLVPLADPEAMAAAIARTLDEPLPRDTLRDAVAAYTPAACAEGYLRACGLLPE
jgi:glycosyltransferase involved in cell wall biosynthesis